MSKRKEEREAIKYNRIIAIRGRVFVFNYINTVLVIILNSKKKEPSERWVFFFGIECSEGIGELERARGMRVCLF